jgi:SAM-dependent methyltransferase
VDTPVRESDVDALVARLREEIELCVGPGEVAPTRPTWEPARIEAGRLAPVTGDRPFHRRAGALGRVRSAVTAAPKWVVRKLVRWYVEPIAAEQRAFNTAALRLVDDLAAWAAAAQDAERRRREDELTRERGARESAQVRADEQLGAITRSLGELAQNLAELTERSGRNREDMRREANELGDRLLRLERRPAEASPAPSGIPGPPLPATAPPPRVPFDYFAFETRMRENRDALREHQAAYVDDFREAAPVLDVGCGRGEFLELLRDAGIEARGVDVDADMALFCQGAGLDVVQGDALAYLEATEPGSLGGIFAAHVVEHLPPPVLVRFLELAAVALRPGGLLVLETPNPVSLVALKHYFADLTHAQPLVPETLAFLVRQAGLHVEETRYLNEPPDAERLRPVPLPAGEGFAEAQAAEDANVRRLNEVVFGPQDYAVVARR